MTDRYHPFNIVEQLELEVAKYTGAPMCAVVNSCTNALGIVLEWMMRNNREEHKGKVPISMPKFSYIGVPMQCARAGFKIEFRDEEWEGEYQLSPYDIWDSARRFRKDMWYETGPTMCYDVMGSRFKCVSFHRTKILGHSQGGAILHNVKEFQNYAEMMRFDGRTPAALPQTDMPTVLGRHCYMDPEVAAALLHNFYYLPDYNLDLPKSNYPDLSQMDIFNVR